MSPLGKILLIVAFIGAIAAAIAGGLLINQRKADAQTLADTVTAKTAAESAQKKAQADAAATDASTKLTTANGKIDDLNTQLTTATKNLADAQSAATTATAAAKDASDKLAAFNTTLGGQTPDQLVADKKKAQDDLAAAQAEQKIIQDQLQQEQNQVVSLQDSLNRQKTGSMPPGISGKVTFVDHAWNFVILDVGQSAGVVPNGELIIYRGHNFLGKVRVTKVDPNDAVAEILPDVKGDIQIGDAVLN